jgi:hypothetical protein
MEVALRLMISWTDGPPRHVELPDDPDDPVAGTLIEEAAHVICLELAAVRGSDKPSDSQDRKISAWLRPVCYQFISHCIEAGLLEHLRNRLKRYRRYTNTENLFAFSLSSMFAEDAANFTPTHRTRLSRELWYAYRHYVPWPFVHGFIGSTRNCESETRLHLLEPQLTDWIITHRALDVDPTSMSAKGHYPRHIEAAVRIERQKIFRLFGKAHGDE